MTGLDPDRLVTLRHAETIAGRSRRTVLAWQAAGMATEKLGGVGHVHVSDLIAWQRDHGRRHGRKRDYI
jgi:hypothetical protein